MQFGSDNQAGASSQVLAWLEKANAGFTPGYGDDDWCGLAAEKLEAFFDCSLDVFFVATGTAANSLALSCLVRPWETILCHHQAHILLDESTAPELFTGGARLAALTRRAGKIHLRHLEQYFACLSDEPPHTSRPAVLSLTQVNEAGQVYTREQLSSLCRFAHAHDMSVHMDGARFANAVVALDCHPAEISWKAGVDVLSLGATKCGALAAEAVVFFNPDLGADFVHRRKRSGHLISKGRFFGAQFVGWLENNHWKALALHANKQARLLAEHLASFPDISLQWPQEANELFITMPTALARKLQESGAVFYQWPANALPQGVQLSEEDSFIRLVTSFMTTDEHVSLFCKCIQQSHQGTTS